jgi:hypothetical protein
MMGPNGKNAIIVARDVQVNAVLGIDSHPEEMIAASSYDLGAQGGMLNIPADQTEGSNELALEVLVVGVEFVPDFAGNENRSANLHFWMGGSFCIRRGCVESYSAVSWIQRHLSALGPGQDLEGSAASCSTDKVSRQA